MECFCDYDPPEVSSVSIRAARKQHKCEECGCNILSGDRYEYVWGIWEGWQDSFKTCPRCLDLREWVKAHVPCFCWAHGNMLDDARETIDQYRHECEGLWFGFLRKLYIVRTVRQQQFREKWAATS